MLSNGGDEGRSRGRPPLSSNGSPPRRATRHKKVLSGDSEISGITDESPSPPLARMSSTENDDHGPFDPSLQLPSLPENKQLSARLHLSDIKAASPLETEAETAILEIIETSDDLTQPIAPENILPLIPEQVVDVIREEEEKEEEDDDEEPSRLPERNALLRSDQNTFARKMADLSMELNEVHAEADDLVADTELAPEMKEYKIFVPTANNIYENCNALFGRSRQKGVDEAVDLEHGHKQTKSRAKKKAQKRKENMADFNEFLVTYRLKIRRFFLIQIGLVACVIGVAAVLFYGTNNPMLGKTGASISWFLIFLARHILLLGLTKATEFLLVDYLALRTKFAVRCLGTLYVLTLVQSRGFPFRFIAWATYSLIFLSGPGKFGKHWLYWQNAVDLFNASNPSGDEITTSSLYYSMMGTALGVGIAVAIKRVWRGLHLGRRTYQRFGPQFTKLMEQMVLISEVSCLSSRQLKNDLNPSVQVEDYSFEDTSASVDRLTGDRLTSFRTVGTKAFDITKLDVSQRDLLNQMLGEWEEPQLVQEEQGAISIRAILEFRQALAHVESGYPFSVSFGLADTREHCVESSRKVYERLLLATPQHDLLPFETIAALAVQEDGTFDQRKTKALIKLFRPDREGNLTLLDFVKSLDTVYKELRLFRASVNNATSVAVTVEKIFDFFFYLVMLLFAVSILGYDPISFMLSISGLLVGFSFMIGNASANYFNGILLIALREPYNIGDRIAIAGVNDAAPLGGSPTWFVQHVDLYTTTVRYATTSEVATLNNGALASMRIINGARSPKAVRYVYLKFPTGTPFKKIQLFRLSVEKFVKARPRKWLAFNGFRATDVRPDLGYIEYVTVLTHRESWQNMGPILTSTAEVTSFCFELSKKLGMEYSAPPMPVNLSMRSSAAGASPLGEGTVSDGSTNIDLGSLDEDASLPTNVQELTALFDKNDK